jgi:hypothetical protein
MLSFDEFDNTIEAQWCWDATTGEECLIDIKTNKVIVRRIKGQIVEPRSK